MKQQQAIDQATNGNLHGEGSNLLTSEVGFGPNQTCSRDVLALLEQQNRNLLELVKRLQMPTSELQQTSWRGCHAVVLCGRHHLTRKPIK